MSQILVIFAPSREYMYLKGFLLFLSLFLSTQLYAQDSLMNREYSLRNDNDFYLLNDSDRYYSNGLFFNYRWASRKTSDQDSAKRVFDVGIAHRIYTPQDLLISDFDDFHRPYAGILSGGVSYATYRKKTIRRSFGLELGLIGEASGGQGFQEWYHNAVSFPAPRGWEYQIPNEFIIDFKGEFNRQIVLTPGVLDLISSTSFSLGTGFTHAMQRIDIRLGKLQWLRNSSFTNALMGAGSDQTPRHNYIFLGYGLQYVAHNITINGSIWNNSAPHTETSQPWVRHFRLGFASSSRKATFKLTYNWLSPEVSNIGRHAYVTLELQLRFLQKD